MQLCILVLQIKVCLCMLFYPTSSVNRKKHFLRKALIKINLQLSNVQEVGELGVYPHSLEVETGRLLAQDWPDQCGEADIVS